MVESWVSIATCSRPSTVDTPREIELCESLTDSEWGSAARCQAPLGSCRRATTACRLAVYQAAYW